MSDEVKKGMNSAGTILIVIFLSQLFVGHEISLVETFKGHVTGRLPIPWWSYVMLIGGFIALILGRQGNKSPKPEISPEA